LTATAESFVLELAAQLIPVSSIEGGAAAGVVVIAPPAGGSVFPEKHLAGVRYEPIAIAASSPRARPLFEWITTAWQGTLAQENGALICLDANGRPQAKREFAKAVLVETTVPTLDAASHNPPVFTVRLAPELTRDVTPPTTLPPAGPGGPDTFLSSSFRLNIDGLDCTRVAKIDSFTVTQSLTGGNALEFSNLRIELSAASAATWRAWFQTFVIDGHSNAANENTGTLAFLNANLASALATINLHNGWRMRPQTQAALSRRSIVSAWSWQSASPARVSEDLIIRGRTRRGAHGMKGEESWPFMN
jgi:hypothetical protein